MFNEDTNNNNDDDDDDNNNNNTDYIFLKNCFLFVFYSDVDSFKDQFPESFENSARETEKTFRHQCVISMVIMQHVRNHSVIALIHKLFNLAYR